ncbi:histidine utilization repressor [Tepidamorphus gemmatus]|nr:histidine utilization repressor [Tepidamorphus gemmatus]
MTALSDTDGPLYERVKGFILRNIGAGAWAHGRRLPSENELVSSLGVSRMTVNRALRELAAAGILVRIQGVGTFIAPPKPRSALIEIRDISEEITARGNRHRAEVLALERVTATPDLAAAFEFPRTRPVFHSVVLHFEDDLPVQLEERHVNPDFAPHYGDQDFTAMTTFEYLQAQTPVTEVEHIITAIAADSRTAAMLQLPRGEPCPLLYRRTWSGTAVVTVNRFIYAGSRIPLGSRYRPVDAPRSG